MKRADVTLVGDGIENPWNARALLAAAAMFEAGCRFRDRVGLAGAWAAMPPDPAAPAVLPVVSLAELAGEYAPIVAFDRREGAASVYGYRLTGGDRPAIVVGNERRGIAADLQGIATQTVAIPLVTRQLTSLNVAAAAAVGLYYLSRGGGALFQVRSQPARRRPAVALIGAGAQAELGSAIRSAGAFGWSWLIVEDRAGVWFGAERPARAEGRAAARRHRNPIRLLPAAADQHYAFESVSVITTRLAGVPLHRASLAGGPRQVVVIPDESQVDIEREDWSRFGRVVQLISLPASSATYPVYHQYLRLVATIAVAEIARQVGQRAAPDDRLPQPADLRYDRALALVDEVCGETVWLDDLTEY